MGDNLCLVTTALDQDWSSFLHWTIMATIYAESENIDSSRSDELPSIGSFGLSFNNFFRRVVGSIGNYNEVYERNLGNLFPRSGRNLLNKNPQTTIQGPNIYIPPGLGM